MKNVEMISKICFLLIITTLWSCEDYLKEEALTEVTANFVYNTEEGLQAAVVGLYDINRSIYDDGRHEWFATLMLPVKSDLAVSRAGVISLFAVMNWGVDAHDYQASLLAIFWRHHYRVVDRANAIIKAAESLESLNPGVRDQVISEAKFFRAHSYFTLYRMFQNIFISTEPTTPDNAFERVQNSSTEEEIFALINADLSFSSEHLDWVAAQPGRVTQATARHLKAKVAMWEENWPEAAAQAEMVINSGDYNLLSDINRVFNSDGNHEESLWTIQFAEGVAGGGSRTMVNWNHIPNYAKVPGAKYSAQQGGMGAGFVLPNNYLLSLFGEDDLRVKDNYFRLYFTYNDPDNLPEGVQLGDTIDIYKPTGETQSKYYEQIHPACIKFVPPGDFDVNSATQYKNYMKFRLAETYLIASEAYMRLNGDSDARALQYINAIRQRAGIEELNAVNQQIILEERARELAFEGHRWFTLKRMGVLVSQIQAHAGDDGFQDQARSKMEPKYVNLPIPQAELDLLGPNYPQNEGY
ncbi:MAG TPA: RagB/SusD family nutrient uptake outer membrane protein [Membranihabitans sp.]|nr:RagB/SusD family nutrient uptake outer membrane protein [Membranihabitans sp.]